MKTDTRDEAKDTALQRLRQEAARTDRLIAQDLILHGRGPEALAYLARAHGYVPESTLAAELAVGMLNNWEHPIPSVICVGHQDRVTAAQFSPDGERIVSASEDKTARVWEARTGKLLRTLVGHTEELETAQFSPDGRLIVTTSYDHTARVWEAESARLLATFEHPGAITCAEFSANGLELLTASEDAVQVWSLGEGRALTTIPHPEGWPDARFSPDGQKGLTTAKEEKKLAWIWDARTGKRLVTLSGHEDQVTEGRFSLDGQRVVTASDDGTARLWLAEDGRLGTTLPHGVKVWSDEFSQDGKRVLTTAEDKAARVWEVDGGKLVATLQHPEPVDRAEFSADGLHVRTVTSDGVARVWDARSGALLVSMALIGYDDSYCDDTPRFSPDGRRIVARSVDNTARVWEVGSQRLAITLRTYSLFAHFSPDGRRLFTACRDARLWDVETGRLLVTLGQAGESEEGPGISRVGFSPDGQRVIAVIARSSDPVVRIQDVNTGGVLLTLEGHQGALSDAKFSPDGQWVATASFDKTARIWDATGGRLVSTLPHEDVVLTVWFSPDGRRLATCSGKRAVHLWEMPTGKLMGTLDGHEAGLKSLRFSPDSQRIVTACADDGTVRVWDADGGRLLLTLHVDHLPQSAQFSSDGKQLLTATWEDAQVWDANDGRRLRSLRRSKLPDWGNTWFRFSLDGNRVVVTDAIQKTAYVWETDSGNPVAILQGHEDDWLQAEFSPDGHKVVTTSNDQTVRIWELLGTSVPPPPWFADFLRLTAQRRFDEDGELVMLSTDDFLALRAKLAAVISAERSRYAAIARWFLCRPDERPLRPGLQ